MEAVVLFDYEKQEPDELDLKVGELITDVKQVDDGWCQGTCKGRTGLFPDNFVQMKTPKVPHPAMTSAPSSERARAPPPDPNPPVVTRATNLASKQRRAKVVFSYQAENDDELSLAMDEVVDVLAEEEEGWWRGKVRNTVGLFPSNFVEVIKEETPPPDSAHQPPVVNVSDGPPQQLPEKRPPPGAVAVGAGIGKFNPLDIKSRLKPTTHAPPPVKKEEPPKLPEFKKSPPVKPPAPPPQEQTLEKARVTFDYRPEQEDELEIKAGDILEVVNKNIQDGWWEVKLNGRVGLVPDNFVELLPPETSAEPPLPAKKAVEVRKPPPPAPPPETQDSPDFGVPATEPLDSSAVKERPHKPSGVRPPSRSNLHQEAEPVGGGEAPWQKELKQRKKKDPVKLPSRPHPPSPSAATELEKKPAPPPLAKKKPSLDMPKPKLPLSKPAVDLGKAKPSPTKPAEPPQATPPPVPEATPPQSSEEWKEALEQLRSEFAEFKEQIRRELRGQIQTLSDDLDEERKTNASLRIDLDRVKKKCDLLAEKC